MRNNFLPYLFFLSLTLVPNVHAQTSRSASMPVPFEPFDTGNAVSAEFLKLYKENPKNTTIPADILAILQNQESLEPPTIIRAHDIFFRSAHNRKNQQPLPAHYQ